MKFETHIHITKLQNEIENQSVKIQRSVCNICRAASKAQNNIT